MDQDWKIFNVSTKESFIPKGGPESSFLKYKQGFLVRSITVPFASPQLEAHLQRLSSIPPAINNKGLLSLPNELLLYIAEPPGSGLCVEEVVMLAMTCQRLYELYRGLIDHYHICQAASWMMNRILCSGSHAKYEDLPAALFKAQERALIETKSKEGGASYGGLSDFCSDDTRLYRGAFTYKPEWLHTFKSAADRNVFKLIMAVTFPSRTDWVLCNHTKKEFVRASAIAELAGKPNDDQPFLPRCKLDLGHALLTRICWSTEKPMDTPDSMKMHRGPWVGDRFYITTMDRRCMPSEGDDWEWKDVSGQVVRDLVRVYRMVFGKKDWLAKVEGQVSEEDWTQYYWFASDGQDDLSSRFRDVPYPYIVRLAMCHYTNFGWNWEYDGPRPPIGYFEL
ncbi:hypothetical protein L226DRAFT_486782 [Lentinus tigrinus ALCF2SS1-7]|uniref:Uncharacterized protein n=1 Tax=Lentinus tigrinus ALCF2SS1-6 TaxID=1328759 RepID=A0A5C2SFL8_9APHY|nr:hypothetical protein L227DRAFT_653629 [Lentinus tigrinus ALCF2SS1-6]RPD74858.1 hypothetical protein L226DRAFT_486782 [Lentinus tigrinus ALCF2SS1-7]